MTPAFPSLDRPRGAATALPARPAVLAALFAAVLAALFAGSLVLPGPASAQDARPAAAAAPASPVDDESFKPESGQSGKDVIWVPTPDDLVQAMLDMARVKAGDIHYDLGSGDGKIAIAAAKRGARSVGIEYNGDMVGLSRRNAARAGVGDQVTFVQGDIFETDFSKADVITLYLLPTLNLRLRPTILAMKPGTRVASHQFSMGDWEPDQRVSLSGRDALAWVVPARIAGTWEVIVDGETTPIRLTVNQHYQKFQGTAAWGGAPADFEGGRIDGARVGFSVTDAQGGVHQFVANAAEADRMSGAVTDAKGGQRNFRATRTTTVTGLTGAVNAL